MKPPVSQHAAVAAGASDTWLTRALPAAGVAQRAASREDGAQGVAGTSCRGEGRGGEGRAQPALSHLCRNTVVDQKFLRKGLKKAPGWIVPAQAACDKLSPRNVCSRKKKMRHVVPEGEKARMGKMCLHGPWEIPPLFAITVTFQRRSSLQVPAEEQSGTVLAVLNVTLLPKHQPLSWLIT